jgi:hypothetical protein
MFGLADWTEIGGYAYPEAYAFARRHRPPPKAVARLRVFLKSVPRANPLDYDILFNVEGLVGVWEGPTWDIVKWMRVPKVQGVWPGVGPLITVNREPFPVYHIPALVRDPLTLGHRDFEIMLQNSTTLQPGSEINDRVMEHNLKKQDERRDQRRQADLEFAEYYRGLFRDLAEEQGA